MKWIKQLLCNHDYEFIRNIHGDEINKCGGYRSIWRCKNCGKIEYRRYLQEFSISQKLCKLRHEYYENKYNEWKELRANTLDGIIEDMLKIAKNGGNSCEIILFCEEKYNDKYYYKKWFTENRLTFDSELFNQSEKCYELNKYKFNISWAP